MLSFLSLKNSFGQLSSLLLFLLTITLFQSALAVPIPVATGNSLTTLQIRDVGSTGLPLDHALGAPSALEKRGDYKPADAKDWKKSLAYLLEKYSGDSGKILYWSTHKDNTKIDVSAHAKSFAADHGLKTWYSYFNEQFMKDFGITIDPSMDGDILEATSKALGEFATDKVRVLNGLPGGKQAQPGSYWLDVERPRIQAAGKVDEIEYFNYDASSLDDGIATEDPKTKKITMKSGAVCKRDSCALPGATPDAPTAEPKGDDQPANADGETNTKPKPTSSNDGETDVNPGEGETAGETNVIPEEGAGDEDGKGGKTKPKPAKGGKA